MPLSPSLEEFVGFMEEYVVFIEHMIDDESEKLAALNQRDITKIEHNIVVSLANAKKLENLENKRTQLMEQAGFGGLTFSEVIDRAPDEDKGPLRVLFTRFEDAVNEIRFRNNKAMTVARDNLAELDPEAARAAQNMERQPNSQYGKAVGTAGQGNLLEQKV